MVFDDPDAAAIIECERDRLNDGRLAREQRCLETRGQNELLGCLLRRNRAIGAEGHRKHQREQPGREVSTEKHRQPQEPTRANKNPCYSKSSGKNGAEAFESRFRATLLPYSAGARLTSQGNRRKRGQ